MWKLRLARRDVRRSPIAGERGTRQVPCAAARRLGCAGPRLSCPCAAAPVQSAGARGWSARGGLRMGEMVASWGVATPKTEQLPPTAYKPNAKEVRQVKKEVKTLHSKAVDSLVVAIDHFNRAWDRGRAETVLIMLDRAFELLLKSIIIHRNGDIRDKNRNGTTIGFDACLRKCLSDTRLKCLSEDDVVALQSLNTLRDAAQHHIIEMSEEHLYIYAQSGTTLFSRLSEDVLKRSLRNDIPQRIIPICAHPPKSLEELFDIEFSDIKKMVRPGSRKRLAAKAKLRSLAILQASLDGKKSQPTDQELDRIVSKINKDEPWRDIFPGVATLTIDKENEGPGISIKITRNHGEEVRLVDESNLNATVIAVRKINDLDYYNTGAREMAKKIGITQHKILWIIEKYNIQSDPEYFKLIPFGKQKHKRYSGKCVSKIRELLQNPAVSEAYDTRNETEA